MTSRIRKARIAAKPSIEIVISEDPAKNNLAADGKALRFGSSND
jgi:hypothetical protein